jgi:hypothetical protein
MAPLDTITSSRPWWASAASWRDQLPMASASTPRPSLVTRLEPTLTTMRRAPSRTLAILVGSGVVEAQVWQWCHALLPRHVVPDLLDQRLQAFARQRRDRTRAP